MAKSVGNVTHARRRARRLRPGRADRLLARRPLPPAARVLGGAHGGGAPVRAAPGRLRAPGAPLARARRRRAADPEVRGAAGRVLRRAARRLQHAARRWPRCSSWSARATAGWRPGEPLPGAAAVLAEMLAVLGARDACSRSDERWTRRRCASLQEREEARLRPRLRARRRAARRAAASAAGRCATPPRGRCWCRSPAVDPLRPQRGARGAARPAAGAPRLGRGRARRPEGCPHGGRAGRDRRRREPRATCAARPTTRGSCARPSPTPTPTRRRCSTGDAAARGRARPGPGPAEPRRDLPQRRGRGRQRGRDPGAAGRRGHPGRVPGLRRRGRAPARRAGPQPRRLPRRGQGARAPGSTAPTPAATRPYTDVDWTGPRGRWCSARRGRACARASARPATTWSRLPLHGRVDR